MRSLINVLMKIRLLYVVVAASEAGGGHVFISYQWDSKMTVLKVRDQLRTAGYKVWIDEDDMCELAQLLVSFNSKPVTCIKTCQCAAWLCTVACKTRNVIGGGRTACE